MTHKPVMIPKWFRQIKAAMQPGGKAVRVRQLVAMHKCGLDRLKKIQAAWLAEQAARTAPGGDENGAEEVGA